MPAAAAAAAAVCLFSLPQFVDSTIRGLLSWRESCQVLLQDLRDQAYFTNRKKVGLGWALSSPQQQGW
jgi:hypothetical protein